MDSITVSVEWLNSNLTQTDLRIVDASWHLPTAGRDARGEFENAHIPGAVFFDIDDCVTVSPLPHMMPSAEDFGHYVGVLGISEQDLIVVYDTLGLFSAARVWWMFRQFGAQRVVILDGGLPEWIKAGSALESGKQSPPNGTFKATFNEGVVAVAEDVLAATSGNSVLVLDARPYARFTAETKESRPGLRSGHMPGSASMPFNELLENGALKEKTALLDVLSRRGYEPGQPVIATCGSGVTAAVIVMALERVGATDVRLYDGSWTEWGGRTDLPVLEGG